MTYKIDRSLLGPIIVGAALTLINFAGMALDQKAHADRSAKGSRERHQLEIQIADMSSEIATLTVSLRTCVH